MVYVSAGLLGVVGAGIAWGMFTVLSRLKHTEDERVELLIQMLPGVNCGACGMAGCTDMAQAMVKGERAAEACPMAGGETVRRIADILSVEPVQKRRKVAQVLCRGRARVAEQRAEYVGIADCRAAQTVAWGPKSCTFGCLGFGTCVKACPVDAIHLAADGVPEVDTASCIGCEQCVEVCPRNILVSVEEGTPGIVRCVTQASGKVTRGVCEMGCIHCKICIRVCPKEAIGFKDGRIRIDPKLCDACGLCVERCPNGVIDLRLDELFPVQVSS